MFREMRRKNQMLTEDEAIAILKKGKSGILALMGDGDYPYAVPISYVYYDSKLYFHGEKMVIRLMRLRSVIEHLSV